MVLLSIVCFQWLCGAPLAEEFEQKGYVELSDALHGSNTYNALYASFDELIVFLQNNAIWTHKLCSAKERFLRSKEKHHYSTDVLGFYDESERTERHQISFYYSTHFHDFLHSRYPEFGEVSAIAHFLDACYEIQQSSSDLFSEAAGKLGVDAIFEGRAPPILLKVIKYFSSYTVKRPHYDGSAFSLFLDSTDNQSLHLSSYKASLTSDDFSSPPRQFSRSVLLIPGAFLIEFSIFPTPHIALPNGKIRYATIAFAMRPNYACPKIEYSSLPSFK